MRLALLVLGWVLIALSPLVGAIPGPGGLFGLAFGHGLVFKYSRLAKRSNVALKRRWPKHGAWADWGLRRASAKRRSALGQQGAD